MIIVNLLKETRQELVFSDLNFTFTPHPVTGKLPVLRNEQAVKKALRNLILTNKYERPYEPLFGGNILSLLFENSDNFLDYQIKKQIELAISNFEPRATLVNVIVNDNNDDNNLEVTIIFFIENQKEPVELTINLERVR